MALANRPIPNLFNGVSQQPASLRHPSQGELQENAYSQIATGLRKRAASEHVKQLSGTFADNAFVHTINQGLTARYEVVISGGALSVFDLATGTLQTLSTPNGTAYLTSSNPRDEFVALTVADFTFIVNKTKVTAMTGTTVGGALSGTKQKFSDLAVAAGTGQVWQIAGDPSNGFDDYYVQDAATSVWVECMAPGATTFVVDAATMPMSLTKTGASTFTLANLSWNQRAVGDNSSNPLPSFIGQTLADVFFFRNRLGFLSGENAILSRAGDYFNFFAKTVTAVLDDDPIDISANHTKVSLLKFAVPFNRALMLFSDQTQFELTAGDVLTPKTAKIEQVTDFESSALAKAVGSGHDMYFVVEKDNFSGVREYFVEQQSITNDAADITAHVPSYLPKNVFKMVASSTEDVLLCLTGDERNAIYVYKSYWGKEEKIQSSWSRWTFVAGDVILGIDMIGTTIYALINRAGTAHLEKINLQPESKDTGMTFSVLLDSKVHLTGAYDAGNDWTTWTLPYAYSGTLQVIMGSAFATQVGSPIISLTRPSTTTIRTTGNYSAGVCHIGKPYTKRYRFSEQFMRDSNNVAITSGRLQLRQMSVNYTGSGYFRVSVTPKARETNTYTMGARILGDIGFTVGTVPLQSGNFKFPVNTSSSGVVIEIINDSHLPSVIQSAEWTAEFVLKARRV